MTPEGCTLNMYRRESFVSPVLALFADEFYMPIPQKSWSGGEDVSAPGMDDVLSGENVVQF